jgi:2,4-dienoyl-CoA reductase (NADPH2)
VHCKPRCRQPMSVHLIGGADKAEELDAKRAIKQGTELAIALGQPTARTKGKLTSQPISTGVSNIKNDSALPFETAQPSA